MSTKGMQSLTEEEIVKAIDEMFPPPLCPGCGDILTYLKDNPHVGCGSITYYRCESCDDLYRHHQAGIIALPTKLEKLPFTSEDELDQFLQLDCWRTLRC